MINERGLRVKKRFLKLFFKVVEIIVGLHAHWSVAPVRGKLILQEEKRIAGMMFLSG